MYETLEKRLGKMRDCQRSIVDIIDILAVSIFDGVIVATSCQGNHGRGVDGAAALYITQGRGRLYPK